MEAVPGSCANCGDVAPQLLRGRCRPCYHKQRYIDKRDSEKATRRRWREANPDYWKQPRIKQAALSRAIARYHGDETLWRAALERDRHACRKCGANSRLHVHHVDGNRLNQTLPNLITLCIACHGRLHREGQLTGHPVGELLNIA
jgi:5-methylcytosine-specific restriction endonuclease McrA